MSVQNAPHGVCREMESSEPIEHLRSNTRGEQRVKGKGRSRQEKACWDKSAGTEVEKVKIAVTRAS